LGLATTIGIAIGVSKGDGAEKADDKPAESPGLRVPVPPVFLGETEVDRDVARQLVAWCGYQGAVQLWRGDHTAETTDATGGIYNVSVEHVEKETLLDGNTLWFTVKVTDGRLAWVEPQKRISAAACRPHDNPPLEAGVRRAVKH
jgi:hypothetical protein